MDSEQYYCPCCDCCGLEFGYDDDPGASGRACSFRQYRVEFVDREMVWFRPPRRPLLWLPDKQLEAAGIVYLVSPPKEPR